jgi:hypothetical protein
MPGTPCRLTPMATSACDDSHKWTIGKPRRRKALAFRTHSGELFQWTSNAAAGCEPIAVAAISPSRRPAVALIVVKRMPSSGCGVTSAGAARRPGWTVANSRAAGCDNPKWWLAAASFCPTRPIAAGLLGGFPAPAESARCAAAVDDSESRTMTVTRRRGPRPRGRCKSRGDKMPSRHFEV